MRKAFTLIELLIVVAIIAILAAIAVPNFLEAQTRSKVSRMKSDMRSLATGLESYCVDNNKYPINPASGVLPCYGLGLLSTPIAYMTNPLIKDVFIPPSAMVIATGTGGSYAVTSPYDTAVQYSLRGLNGTAVDVGISGMVAGQQGQWWLLRSLVPTETLTPTRRQSPTTMSLEFSTRSTTRQTAQCRTATSTVRAARRAKKPEKSSKQQPTGSRSGPRLVTEHPTCHVFRL